MVWDRSALRPFIYWRFPYYVHVHRLQPASAGQCKKDPLHRLRRQRHVSADPDLAAVPVLVAHGKAGVKGCDFAIISHVHNLLCVHVCVIYT